LKWLLAEKIFLQYLLSAQDLWWGMENIRSHVVYTVEIKTLWFVISRVFYDSKPSLRCARARVCMCVCTIGCVQINWCLKCLLFASTQASTLIWKGLDVWKISSASREWIASRILRIISSFVVKRLRYTRSFILPHK